MDWSKAKSILIIALLIVCIILSVILANRRSEIAASEVRLREDCEVYLKNHGLQLSTQIPDFRPDLGVLYVSYEPGTQSAEEDFWLYNEYEVHSKGNDANDFQLISESKTSGKISSAATALMKAASKLISLGISDIKEIKLVYYIDTIISDEIPENIMAVPSWQIIGEENCVFVSAF